MPYKIEEFESLTKWMTLEDLPSELPIGVHNRHGEFIANSEYIAKILNGHHEIFLGDLEDRYQKNLYKVYSQFLPEICESIEGLPLKQGKDNYLDFIANMYLADVLAILVTVRIYGQGRYIPLSSTCICHKQMEIVPKNESEYHDLGTLKTMVWLGKKEPIFEYQLHDPVHGLKVVNLSPPKFKDVFDEGFIDSELNYENKLAILLSDIDEETFESLSRQDRTNLLYCATKMSELGLETSIQMYCDPCDRDWDANLYLGINSPSFYLNLLSPPRLTPDGSVREYINKIVFFLTMGDQAPFKSRTEVLNMTPQDRQQYVEQLSETYKEQQRQMKKK